MLTDLVHIGRTYTGYRAVPILGTDEGRVTGKIQTDVDLVGLLLSSK